MDWAELSSRTMDCIRKYRYIVLVVLAGIILMTLPDSSPKESVPKTSEATQKEQPALQESLASILSKIEGAGKVEVLLTQAAGERMLYQMDETVSSRQDSEEKRTEVVVVTESDRRETGLIQQVIPPVYLGAVVICQGADQASVRLCIVDAVSDATGLTSDKITVLKMK